MEGESWSLGLGGGRLEEKRKSAGGGGGKGGWLALMILRGATADAPEKDGKEWVSCLCGSMVGMEEGG